MRRREATELLGLNKFNVDEAEPHIILDKKACEECRDKPCLLCCPAALYTIQNNKFSFDYAGCLECGTCRLICANGGITRWEYPRGTFGVAFRYG